LVVAAAKEGFAAESRGEREKSDDGLKKKKWTSAKGPPSLAEKKNLGRALRQPGSWKKKGHYFPASQKSRGRKSTIKSQVWRKERLGKKTGAEGGKGLRSEGERWRPRGRVEDPRHRVIRPGDVQRRRGKTEKASGIRAKNDLKRSFFLVSFQRGKPRRL